MNFKAADKALKQIQKLRADLPDLQQAALEKIQARVLKRELAILEGLDEGTREAVMGELERGGR